MRRLARTLIPAAAVAAALATTGTAARAQFTVYALTTGVFDRQQLVSFNTASPGAVTTLGYLGAGLSGLSGLDFRPSNGVLYASGGGVGRTVFTVNTSTGTATPLFDVPGTIEPLSGFDFNPAADRLRATDRPGDNYRINVDAGAITVDGTLSYASGDANAGRTPNLAEVAYTNNDNDPATGTTLYGIDRTSGTLAVSTNPNAGTYTTVGSLGLGNNFATINGFDIVTVGSTNLAFLSVLSGLTSRLYTVNLTSGAATLIGDVGVAGGVTGLAVVPAVAAVPEPGTLGLLGAGVSLLGVVTLRRRARTA